MTRILVAITVSMSAVACIDLPYVPHWMQMMGSGMKSHIVVEVGAERREEDEKN